MMSMDGRWCLGRLAGWSLHSFAEHFGNAVSGAGAHSQSVKIIAAGGV
jgi:hypothetical protein